MKSERQVADRGGANRDTEGERQEGGWELMD